MAAVTHVHLVVGRCADAPAAPAARKPLAMKLETRIQSRQSPAAIANATPSPGKGEVMPRPIAVPKLDSTSGWAGASSAPARIAPQST